MMSQSGRPHPESKGKKEEGRRTYDELSGVVELRMGSIPCSL